MKCYEKLLCLIKLNIWIWGSIDWYSMTLRLAKVCKVAEPAVQEGSGWSMTWSAFHFDYNCPDGMKDMFASSDDYSFIPAVFLKHVQLRPKWYQVHTFYICQRNDRTKMEMQIFQCSIPSLESNSTWIHF